MSKVAWPRIATFDNSATPGKGQEPRQVKTAPVDLEALKAMMGAAAEEAAANDPKALKAELAKAQRELAAALKHPAAAPPAVISEAERKRLHTEGFNEALRLTAAERESERAEAFAQGADAMLEQLQTATTAARAKLAPPKAAPKALAPPRPGQAAKPAPPARAAPVRHVAPTRPVKAAPAPVDGVTGPQAHVLKALAWWKAMGNDTPTRAQVCAIAGWSLKSGHIKNVVSSLRTAGLIDYPRDGSLAMTAEGEALAPDPDLGRGFRDSLRATLTGPQRQVFDALVELGGHSSRLDLVAHLGWSAGSGHIKNVVSSMRTLDVIDYPADGEVALTDWAAAE